MLVFTCLLQNIETTSFYDAVMGPFIRNARDWSFPRIWISHLKFIVTFKNYKKKINKFISLHSKLRHFDFYVSVKY